MKRYGFFLTIALLPQICSGQSINKVKVKNLVEEARKTNTEALIVYHNDRLVIEEYIGIGRADAKVESMSCTKSIVGLAVACLLSDGLLRNLDVPVYEFYPQWKQGQKQLITDTK